MKIVVRLVAVLMALTLPLLSMTAATAAPTPDGTTTPASPPRNEQWHVITKCSGSPSVNDVCWGYVYQLASQAGGCSTPSGCIYAGGKYWVYRPRYAPPSQGAAFNECMASIGLQVVGLFLGGPLVAVAISGLGGAAMTIYTCARA